MELVQEILKVFRRRLLIAFQPKQVRDVIVANGVHAGAKSWLVRQIASGLVESFRRMQLRFRSFGESEQPKQRRCLSRLSRPAASQWQRARLRSRDVCNADSFQPSCGR